MKRKTFQHQHWCPQCQKQWWHVLRLGGHCRLPRVGLCPECFWPTKRLAEKERQP